MADVKEQMINPPIDESKPEIIEENVKTNDLADNVDDDKDDAEGESGKKLTKKEKEKLKKQKQKEREKAKKEEEKAKKEKKAAGGGVGALARKALELQKQKEEEERAAIEAEEKRLAAIQAEKEEKARIERERKQREREKKKVRIERQKAEGTYKTPEERAKQRKAQEDLQRLQEQGIIEIGPGNANKQKKKPIYGNLKNAMKQKKDDENIKEAQSEKLETQSATNTDTSPEQDIQSEDEIADDWLAEVNSEAEDDDDIVEDTLAKEEKEQEKNNYKEIGEKKIQLQENAKFLPETVEAMKITEHEHHESISSNATIDFDEPETIPAHETKEQMFKRIADRLKKRHERAIEKKDTKNLRSPIIVVLGHVDTGKTKMLDKIRRSNVQDGEAGGITQQIGATEVPADAIRKQGAHVKGFDVNTELELPGFLIIDTPGHEQFRNLRSRGSNMCDIAILIVDIMHGLEPQTRESIQLLLNRKCPFVVGLNKVDRLYEWKSSATKDIRSLIQSQKMNTQQEYQERLADVTRQFNEEGLNVCMYWEREEKGSDYVPMVPTSAAEGDGVGNLMVYIAQFAQKYQRKRLAYIDSLEATVMEVKEMPGLGTTIDVILVNGTLRYGDTIVVGGIDGPIVTQIRDLQMPEPLKELRVKNFYRQYKEIKGAVGVKVLAKNLEKALAGLPLFVAKKDDEIDFLCEEINNTYQQFMKTFKLKAVGVRVHASTLGSLEALLEFLRHEQIPYSSISIGPVHRRDITIASTMLEHGDGQFACILAFDVTVDREAQQEADKQKVKVFQADIIYHLEDMYQNHRKELLEAQKRAHASLAIFPCKLRVLPEHMFKTRDPIICGVAVEAGTVKVGTPLCVPDKDCLFIGTVASVEVNNKPVEKASAGQEVCIKIENTTSEAPKMYDRHFNHENVLVSRISRETIDVCKQYFRDELTRADWTLIIELKKLLSIF